MFIFKEKYLLYIYTFSSFYFNLFLTISVNKIYIPFNQVQTGMFKIAICTYIRIALFTNYFFLNEL